MRCNREWREVFASTRAKETGVLPEGDGGCGQKTLLRSSLQARVSPRRALALMQIQLIKRCPADGGVHLVCLVKRAGCGRHCWTVAGRYRAGRRDE